MKKEKNLGNKVFYDHFKEVDQRGLFYCLKKGYNILNLDERTEEYKTQIKMRNTDSDWNKTIKFAGGICNV